MGHDQKHVALNESRFFIASRGINYDSRHSREVIEISLVNLQTEVANGR